MIDRPDQTAEIADSLVTARRLGAPLTGFPGAIPADLAEAYQVQDLAIQQWGGSVVGWKIGFIAAHSRTPTEPDRLIGPIWADQRHRYDPQQPPVEMPIFTSGFAAVEAEIVIRLDTALAASSPSGGRWTADEVSRQPHTFMLGIEVASSPVPDINALGPTVIAADFGNNNGLVTSDPVGAWDLAAQLTCSVDGQVVGVGRGDQLPGGPHHAVATALNILADRGRTAGAGTLFATGAITGIHGVSAGRHCRVVAPGLSVEVRTTDRGEPG